MKKNLLFAALLLVCIVTVPSMVRAEQQPEMIGEKMAIKFVRGITNTATSIVELPKQTILTGREMGPVGYVVGPLKGVGMTMYRAFIGAVEMVFFLVPQPGYYDPTIDPAYVWQGWEPKKETTRAVADEK
jgi:putative exosortase-associated protein (TIGR04073 family)